NRTPGSVDLDDVPTWFLAALPAAMGEVLDRLAAQHGSVREYVLSIGVQPAALETLADSLLVDP
ncbi:MAG: hypothetical protein JWN99_2259, partial [Ilumatobacteraceae bacterium]|nr:hypothetical protein [Ilumatobacteraceae bacterium]